MAETTLFKPLGVVEEPSEPNQPEGAMRVAHNVSLREAGVIQPRPRLAPGQEYIGGTGVVQANNEAMVEYRGEIFNCQVNVGTEEQVWSSVNSPLYFYTPPATGVPVQAVDGFFQNVPVAKARDNLYFCQLTGTRKISDLLDGTIRDTGAPTNQIVNIGISGFGSFLPAGEFVGYRVTTVRKDPSGLIVESVPSPARVIENTLGAPAGVDLDFLTTLNSPLLQEDDEVYIYRTPNSASASVGDEYRLVASVRMEDIVPGGTDYFDDIPQADLGAALYTSPSQQGTENGNFRPPTARSVANFRNSLFWGNVTEASRIPLNLKAYQGDLTGQATGIGARQILGTATSGSPVITDGGSLDVTGIQVGSYLLEGATGFPNGARVIAVDSVTPSLTMDVNANASGGVAEFVFDTIAVSDGTTSEFFVIRSSDFARIVGWWTNKGSAGPTTGTSSSIVEATELTPRPGFESAASIELFDRNPEGFTIEATHGEEYFPVLPSPSDLDPLAVLPEPAQGTLWWSKADQPEHVPLQNFVRIGANSEPILRIVPTKDRMYVFKTDGVWAVTGFSADSGWRVDPIDLDCILIAPNSVQVVDDSIVFLSDKGVEMLTGSTVTTISNAVSRTYREVVKVVAEYNQGSAWSFAIHSHYDPRTRDYILSTPILVGAARGDTVIPQPVVDSNVGWNVFNFSTKQWCSWAVTSPFPRQSAFGVYGSVFHDGELFMGAASNAMGDFLSLRWVYDEMAADAFPTQQPTEQVVWTRTSPALNQPYGSTGTFLLNGPVAPYSVMQRIQAGELTDLYQVYYPGAEVPEIDSGPVIVDGELQANSTYDNAPASGTHAIWQPFYSIVWPSTQFAGEPTEIKHWQEVAASFQSTERNAFAWTFETTGDGIDAGDPGVVTGEAQKIDTALLDGFTVQDPVSGTRVLTDEEPIPLTFPSQSNVETRAYVPQGSARSTSLNFYLTAISGIGGWKLFGFWLKHRYSGKRSPLGYKRQQF